MKGKEEWVLEVLLTILVGAIIGLMGTLATLVVAIIGLVGAFGAVRYDEIRRQKHQKKYIATALYFDIKILKNKINLLYSTLTEMDFYAEIPICNELITDSLYGVLEEFNIDPYNKPLYTTSGLYYQFIKDIYIFEDTLIEKILLFYHYVVAADECYQLCKKQIKSTHSVTVSMPVSSEVKAGKDFLDYILKLNNMLPDLLYELEKYVNVKTTTPITESPSTIPTF